MLSEIRAKMRFRIRKGLGSLLAALVGVGGAAAHEPQFERGVKPIFRANCFSCHGGTAMIGLDLRTAASILQGSHQGPVVVPGSPQKSLLYQKVASRAMPPPAFALELTDEEIETIRKWIEAGAPSEEGDANQKKLQAAQIRFEREILPILRSRCFACHGIDNPMAGLDLRTVESVLKGSANGPVISEGGSDKSILIRMISTKSMPPPGTADPLSEPELEKLRQWVDTLQVSPRMLGVNERVTFTKVEAREVTAKDRQLWAFRKPVKRPVPKVKNQKRVRTPIDAFVLAELEAKGLTFSAVAPELVLMRRAHFDLVGLPPAPGRDCGIPGWQQARGLRKVDRRSARITPLWRAVGAPLVGPGWLHRCPAFRQQSGRYTPVRRHLALSGLRRSVAQRRQAVRPLPHGADRWRRASRLAFSQEIHSGNPRLSRRNRLSAERVRPHGPGRRQPAGRALRRAVPPSG